VLADPRDPRATALFRASGARFRQERERKAGKRKGESETGLIRLYVCPLLQFMELFALRCVPNSRETLAACREKLAALSYFQPRANNKFA